jgi:hypothetical protein
MIKVLLKILNFEFEFKIYDSWLTLKFVICSQKIFEIEYLLAKRLTIYVVTLRSESKIWSKAWAKVTPEDYTLETHRHVVIKLSVSY